MRILIIVLALLFASACNAGAQRRALDATGIIVDAAIPALLVAREIEGNAAIDAAHSFDEAQASIERIKASWRPLFDAIDMFRSVHNTLSDASDRGQPIDVIALAAAYCGVRTAAIGRANLPNVLGMCNE